MISIICSLCIPFDSIEDLYVIIHISSIVAELQLIDYLNDRSDKINIPQRC